MTRQEEKQQLRQMICRLEAQLSDAYKIKADRAIAAHLLAMPEYQAAETVLCFVGTFHEIDTKPILKDILSSGKTLCVPCITEDQRLEARRIVSLEQFAADPTDTASVLSPDAIDFAILPCVTCSRLGARLGTGDGSYDRFLSLYRGGALLLCREQLLREEIPVEPHDCQVPWVLTERGLYEDGIPARLS